MKKLFTFLTGLVFALNMNAQTTLTQAVDFTVTDVDGNSHNLFSILNSGKYVCLDFWFVNCPPCQSTSPFYKQAYQNYGCNSHEIFFMAIDNGDATAAVNGFENTYLGGPPGYPVISGNDGNGNAVCSAYGITAYPTYILIAPNGNIIEQDMWPISSAATFGTYFTSHNLQPHACPTGVTEVADNALNLNLFPNPATSTLSLESTAALNNYQITDALGRTVATASLQNTTGRHDISIAELQAGMYFITVTGKDGLTSRMRFQKI